MAVSELNHSGDSFKDVFKTFSMSSASSYTMTFPDERSCHLICITSSAKGCQALIYAFKTQGTGAPQFYRIDDKSYPTITANNNSTLSLVADNSRAINVVDFVLYGSFVSMS